jgi:hypothetical protein
MRRYSRNLVKIFAVCFLSCAIIAVLPHEGTAQNPWASQPVLTATSSASEYSQFEPILLTLTLSLRGRDIYVTTYEAGTIGIVSATRDGKPIQPAIGIVDFDSNPQSLQSQALRRLTAGTAVTIPLDLLFAPLYGVSQIRVKQLDPAGTDLNLSYPLRVSGLYVLQFVYEYTGPDHSWTPRVFRGKILSNAVRFRVR